ncbi:hypothetical protein AB0H57_25355 [Micromonospora sp. NPDC050686]|uniref:hypothetical protein n=1 Tax=Micromonospora sp. NPDC050686 TaxID=3154631 RepID=UPI0033C24900
MSNQPGSSTAAQPDRPADADPGVAGGPPAGDTVTGPADGALTRPAGDTTAGPAAKAGPEPAEDAPGDIEPTTGGTVWAPGAPVLALVAAGWLAAMLWSTRQAIESAAAGVTALSLSAFALPGVISAALVAGTAVALATTDLVARRGADRATLRFLVAIGTGLLVGLVTAVAINLTYPDNATTNTIAGTSAAAAIIGGALAGARTAAPVGAVVAATLGTLVFVVAFSRARDPLFDLFGADGTQAGMVAAARWVSRTESLLAGLLAGLIAFGYLSWARRRAARRDPAAPALRWPAYLLAGAGPGLLLLLAELIIRVGGRRLLDLAAALSDADAVAQTSMGASRMDNAIWVLFVGALTALIAFGRTLGPTQQEDEEPADR